MLRTVTRRAETVWRTEDISRVIASVADDIRRGRPQAGAVEIPIDQQYRHGPGRAIDGLAHGGAPRPSTRTPWRQAATCSTGPNGPLIWAGGGVVSADASAELLALATRLGAPVVTTLEGRGAIPEDHPLALGPRTERPSVAEIIAEADVVLAVGTRFQNYSTRVWKLPIPGKIIHLDADPGDDRPQLPGRGRRSWATPSWAWPPSSSRWRPAPPTAASSTARRNRWWPTWSGRGARSAPTTGPWPTMVRRVLPRDALVVRDSTVPVYLWGNRVLPILEPRTSIRPSSTSIGPGIGAGHRGRRRHRTADSADGGRRRVPARRRASWPRWPSTTALVICVFNDGGYGVLRAIQDAVMGERFGVDLQPVRFDLIAEGMGIRSPRVSGGGRVRAGLHRGRGLRRPHPARHRPHGPGPHALSHPTPPTPQSLTPRRPRPTPGPRRPTVYAFDALSATTAYTVRTAARSMR